MVGFSSRLREKLESTRSNAATGHGPRSDQPKNIRGLTRLGANTPSGGLSGGHNNSVGGAHGTGGSTVGNSVPLPIQTSSLRKENGGQGTSTSAVHRPPPRSASLLVESKIVPGWGARSSNDTKHAPSGHLGGIKPRDHPAPREMDKRPGEEPSLPPATLSQLSLSKRRLNRWGDDEDEGDEDFPQVRVKTLPEIGSHDRGLRRDENHGERQRKPPCANGSRWGALPSPHSLATGGSASGGNISSSHGLADGDGSKHNSSRHLQHSRVGSEGYDTKRVWHGHDGKGDSHPPFSQSRASDEVKQREVMAGSAGKLTHPTLKHSRDPDSTRHHGSSDASLSRAGNRSLYQRFVSDDSTRRVSDDFTRRVSDDSTRRVSDESTPMVLLRSNETVHMAQTRKEDNLAGSSDASHATVHERTEATQLSQLARPVLNNTPQPPHASKSVVSSFMSTQRSPSPILEEESQEGTPDSSVATKKLGHSASDCNLQVAELTIQRHSHEDMKKDRKDREIEQQQNVLRQVAERRAAATATVKGKSLLEKSNGAQWERGRQLPPNVEDGKEVESLAMEPVQCHKKGAEPDGLESSDKPKQKRRNPCRIEGHDHDWNKCPNNPKSESFVRNNPCRIEGHEHDWNDCPDNPKSDNHVSPINRKGRKGPMSSTPNEKSRKSKPTVSSPTTVDESSSDSKVMLNNGKTTKKRTPDEEECKEDATKITEGSRTNGVKSTSGVSKELPVPVDSSKKSTPVKPFVPAPPPTVSAWMSPAPPEILSPTMSSTLETTKGTKLRTQPVVQSTPNQLDQLKELETETFTMSSHNAHQKQLSPTNQNNAQMPLINSPVVLSPANDALFGKTSGSTSVYGSWNLPPTVMSSMDDFGLNLFIPSNATAPSTGEQFGSIWSDCAVPLGTSRSKRTKRNSARRKKR